MVDIHRSYLFAPANHARRVEKALALPADAVILDLEDAVALREKPAARDAVVAALARPRRVRVYVRVNAPSTPLCHGDLVSVVPARPDGIVIPKIETADELRAIDWLMAQIEGECGFVRGGIDLIPIVETGRGIVNACAIAASGARVRRLAFGAGDFTLDVGIAWTRDETELGPHRAALVTASRAAGLEPPLDSVWIDLADQEGLRASARRVKAMGYQGKMCIHPDQIAAVNEVFRPAAGEVREARRIVDAFRGAEAQGRAAIQLDGRFIDYPIYERAKRVVAADDAITAAERTRSQ
jgi:citrate lyase subunit beta/citryl-CoA lyase